MLILDTPHMCKMSAKYFLTNIHLEKKYFQWKVSMLLIDANTKVQGFFPNVNSDAFINRVLNDSRCSNP